MAPSSSASSSKTGSTVLAKLIRDRRHQLGMSRQELAKATSVPYSTIAQIETAYRGVSPARLGVIARALQLDPADLYDILAREPAVAVAPRSPDRGATGPDDVESWHANPGYLAAAPPPSVVLDDAIGAGASTLGEVVDRVVELLNQLPADQQLGALSRVQSRLLAELVQQGIRSAAHRDD